MRHPRHPLPRLRGRGSPRRRAHRPVERADRTRDRGVHVPRQRRPEELRAPVALRRRHRVARGLRIRRAERDPAYGVWRMPPRRDPARPLVAVVFYRAHLVAGNTQFVENLCDALEAAGTDAVAWWCYSLRDQAAANALVALVHQHDIDVVVTTILAAGGVAAGAGTTGRSGGLDG